MAGRNGIIKTIHKGIPSGHANTPTAGAAMMKTLTDSLATAMPKE
jgi:hypothetical protein